MADNFFKKVIELLELISGGGGGGSGATETTLLSVDSKLPDLSGGKIPVEVGSLNVTVDNANLEISNDVGNPVPASISSLPLPTGASSETTLLSIEATVDQAKTSLQNIDSNTSYISNIDNQTQDIYTKINGLLGSIDDYLRPDVLGIRNQIEGINPDVSDIKTAVENRIPFDLSVTSNRLLVDGSGVTQGVQGTRLNSGADTTSGKTHLTVGGSDGTNLRVLVTDTSGRLITVPSTSQYSSVVAKTVTATATPVTETVTVGAVEVAIYCLSGTLSFTSDGGSNSITLENKMSNTNTTRADAFTFVEGNKTYPQIVITVSANSSANVVIKR